MLRRGGKNNNYRRVVGFETVKSGVYSGLEEYAFFPERLVGIHQITRRRKSSTVVR